MYNNGAFWRSHRGARLTVPWCKEKVLHRQTVKDSHLRSSLLPLLDVFSLLGLTTGFLSQIFGMLKDDQLGRATGKDL